METVAEKKVYPETKCDNLEVVYEGVIDWSKPVKSIGTMILDIDEESGKIKTIHFVKDVYYQTPQ